MGPAHEGAKRLATDVVELLSGEGHEGDAIGQGEAEEAVALASQTSRHMAGDAGKIKGDAFYAAAGKRTISP